MMSFGIKYEKTKYNVKKNVKKHILIRKARFEMTIPFFNKLMWEINVIIYMLFINLCWGKLKKKRNLFRDYENL